MAAGETTDFPTFAEYFVGDHWPKSRMRLVRATSRLVIGLTANPVDYRKLKIDPHAMDVLPRLAPNGSGVADSSMPAKRRTRKNLALVGVNKLALDEAKGILAGMGRDVREAVVGINRGGDIVAGPLPNDSAFGTYSQFEGDEEQWNTLYFRTPGPIVRVGGLALVSGDMLYIPDKTEVLGSEIQRNEAAIWPGQATTPIV